MDHLVTMPILPGQPLDALAALGTTSVSFLPINAEVSRAEPQVRLSLPAWVSSNWPNEINLILALAVDQLLRAHIAHIEKLFFGENLAVGQGCLDRGRHGKIGQGRWGGLHIGDQMRQVLITTLGHMDFVAGPGR
jgi:hypothetical protein